MNNRVYGALVKVASGQQPQVQDSQVSSLLNSSRSQIDPRALGGLAGLMGYAVGKSGIRPSQPKLPIQAGGPNMFGRAAQGLRSAFRGLMKKLPPMPLRGVGTK